MKGLLDTCSFLWVVTDDGNLSDRAREAIRAPENEVFVSSISAWEITVKHALGRLPLPDSPERVIPTLRQDHGIEPLPLNEESALHLARLPALHRDPFDRLLVCQALVGGMALATPDRLVTQYPVRVVW